MKPVVLFIALTCTFAGCANPINGYTAQRYYEYGVQAERLGDLALAQRNYSRAYGNARMGNLGSDAEASYLYEYARVVGYAGQYDESEKSFIQVLELIAKSKGSADRLLPAALSEYARLLHDTGQHSKAVPIYEKAVIRLEIVSVASKDPLGYAELLEEYSKSLREIGDLNKSTEINLRATSLREAHKSDTQRYTARRYKA